MRPTMGSPRGKARWPFGFRLLLWFFGSLAVILLITAVLFVLGNLPA